MLSFCIKLALSFRHLDPAEIKYIFQVRVSHDDFEVINGGDTNESLAAIFSNTSGDGNFFNKTRWIIK